MKPCYSRIYFGMDRPDFVTQRVHYIYFEWHPETCDGVHGFNFDSHFSDSLSDLEVA